MPIPRPRITLKVAEVEVLSKAQGKKEKGGHKEGCSHSFGKCQKRHAVPHSVGTLRCNSMMLRVCLGEAESIRMNTLKPSLFE